MPLQPPLIFTSTYTFSALSLTSLSLFMTLTPHLYHKHILRSATPSTSDLFITTQLTPAAVAVLHDTIRSSGVVLGCVSGYLWLLPRGRATPSAYGLIAAASVGVIGSHLVLLKDVIVTPVLRNHWLHERDRVGKYAFILGVNALTAVVCAWAAFGGWPWVVVHTGFFRTESPVSSGGGGSGSGSGSGGRGGYGGGKGDADLDLEGMMGDVVKGVVEAAGGFKAVAKGLLGFD